MERTAREGVLSGEDEWVVEAVRFGRRSPGVFILDGGKTVEASGRSSIPVIRS